MKQLMIKILTVPFVSYFLMMLVIIFLQEILGRVWIKDTLNNSGFGVWIVLTFVLIVVIISQYLIKEQK